MWSQRGESTAFQIREGLGTELLYVSVLIRNLRLERQGTAFSKHLWTESQISKVSVQELGKDEKTSGSRTQRERARITYSRQALSLSSRRQLEGGQEHRAQMRKQNFLTDKSTMVQESQAGSSTPTCLPKAAHQLHHGVHRRRQCVCHHTNPTVCVYTGLSQGWACEVPGSQKKHSFYLELDGT